MGELIEVVRPFNDTVQHISKTAYSTMSSQSMHRSGIIYLGLKRHR